MGDVIDFAKTVLDKRRAEARAHGTVLCVCADCAPEQHPRRLIDDDINDYL